MGHNSTKLFWIVAPSLAVALSWAVSSDRAWFAPEQAVAASAMHGMGGNGDDYVKEAFGQPEAAPAKAGKTAANDARSASTVRATATAGSVKPSGDYFSDKWHPIHFKPMIDTASNEQCLACHKEIGSAKPLEKSPAGVKTADSLAWYQTLDTYSGAQSDFHARHLTSAFAKETMDLKCNFCHQGNDPREEVPGSHAENVADTSHAMRKMVDPADTCLRCHGKFPNELMTGLEGPWHEARANLEDPENPDMRNGCMTCHKEMFRTVRHQVTYLKAENIEKLAAEGSSDVCYGCHGGRQWYRTNYAYPRHPWPTEADNVPEKPEWAKSRATESDERYRRAK